MQIFFIFYFPGRRADAGRNAVMRCRKVVDARHKGRRGIVAKNEFRSKSNELFGN